MSTCIRKLVGLTLTLTIVAGPSASSEIAAATSPAVRTVAPVPPIALEPGCSGIACVPLLPTRRKARPVLPQLPLLPKWRVS